MTVYLKNYTYKEKMVLSFSNGFTFMCFVFSSSYGVLGSRQAARRFKIILKRLTFVGIIRTKFKIFHRHNSLMQTRHSGKSIFSFIRGILKPAVITIINEMRCFDL